MRLRFYLFTFLTLFCIIPNAVKANANFDFNDDEIIWLEVECGEIGSGWDVQDSENASNGKFVSIASALTYLESPSTHKSDHIDITFDVQESGLFRLWARTIVQNEDENSFWVRMNGGEWSLWNSIPEDENWQWQGIYDAALRGKALSYVLGPGTHTMTIAHREGNGNLDKIMLANIAYEPQELGGIDDSCSSTTSLKENSIRNIEIYISPNPVTNNIEITSELLIDKVRIMNLRGKELQASVFQHSGHSQKMEIELPSGMYILVIYSGRESISKQLVIQ